MYKVITGIYSITNKLNGKVYYGQSCNIYNRWHQHRTSLTNNTHENSHLQHSWNKYGKNNFEFAILKECSVECLVDTEQEYLNRVKKNPQLHYNVSTNAKQSMLGYKHTEDNKRKISTTTKLAMANLSIEKKSKMKTGQCKVPGNHDKIVYAFLNKFTEEQFQGLRCELIKKYNLNPSLVNSILKGRRKSHKGWILI